jgi:TPR repeat protein
VALLAFVLNGSSLAETDDVTVCPLGIPESSKAAILTAFERNDNSQAYRLLLPFAETGSSQAQLEIFYLAAFHPTIFFSGDQFQSAFELLKKSALSGCAPALQILADVYEGGWRHVPRDKVLAECFFATVRSSMPVEHCATLQDLRAYPFPSLDRIGERR